MYGPGQGGQQPGGYNAPPPVLGAQHPGGTTRLALRWVDPVSVAKTLGMIWAILAFIGGVLIFVFGTAAASSARNAGPLAGLVGGFGFVGLIFLPILYGIGGFIGGLIMGALYNLAAKMMGGIKYEVEQTYY